MLDGVVARQATVYSLFCEICFQGKDKIDLGSSRHTGGEIVSTI